MKMKMKGDTESPCPYKKNNKYSNKIPNLIIFKLNAVPTVLLLRVNINGT